MRRPVRRSVFRAAIGLLAAPALAAGFGPASTAFAEDGAPLPVAITGENHVDLSLQSDDDDDPSQPQVVLRLAAPGSDEPSDDGVVPVVHQGPYTIKIDASGLKGVAAVKLPCDATGLTAVCDRNEINAGEAYNRIGGIRLDIDADSAAGDFGTIKVTGEGEGVDFAPSPSTYWSAARNCGAASCPSPRASLPATRTRHRSASATSAAWRPTAPCCTSTARAG